MFTSLIEAKFLNLNEIFEWNTLIKQIYLLRKKEGNIKKEIYERFKNVTNPTLQSVP